MITKNAISARTVFHFDGTQTTERWDGLLSDRPQHVSVADAVPLGTVRDDGAVYTTCGWQTSGRNVWVTKTQVEKAASHGWEQTGRSAPFMGLTLLEIAR